MSVPNLSTYRDWLKSWEFIEDKVEKPFAVWKYYTKDSTELPLIQRSIPVAIFLLSKMQKDEKGSYIKAMIDTEFLDSKLT